MLGSRSGQLLNWTDLTAPRGLSVLTINEWLSILETAGQVLIIHPYFENFGKRLIKSPKIYFADSGLACYLLGLRSVAALRQSSLAGALFEGFVASEIVKQQINAGRARSLYYFRDQRGLEIDFVVPVSADHVTLIEAKSSQTVYPYSASRMPSLVESMGRFMVRCLVVHDGVNKSGPVALTKGVRSTDLAGLLKMLSLPT